MGGIKQVKCNVADLVEGMYVSGLDRPWSQTPFPLQGFFIREANEIEQLRLYCKFVYIDVQRGRGPVKTDLQTNEKEEGGEQSEGGREKAQIKVSPLKIRHNFYRETTPLHKETGKADKLHSSMAKTVDEVMSKLAKGKGFEPAKTRDVANQMVDSVIRNPDAFG